MRTRWSASVAIMCIVTLSSCTKTATSLPDLAAEYGNLKNVLILQRGAAGNGNPPAIGPITDRGLGLDMFAACLGGGRIKLQAVDGDGRPGATTWGDCDGTQIGGAQFGGATSQSRTFCLVPSFEGTATAWEVLITEDKGLPQTAVGGMSTNGPCR